MNNINKFFYLGIALYVLSFFLPTYPLNDEVEVLGYEAAISAMSWSSTSFISDNLILNGLQFGLMNLTNPLILIFVLSVILDKGSPRFRYLLGTIALVSAFIFFPYFMSVLYTYFSFGYYCWISSIFVVFYFGNGASFKRPQLTVET